MLISKRKIVFIVTLSLVLLIFFEVLLRFVLVFGYGASLFTPNDMIFKKYPKLQEHYHQKTPLNDNACKILLLGASVLHENFGDIEYRLKSKLNTIPLLPYEIVNLSKAGHTTRDSFVKHKILENQSFDFVIIYHGINDVRANNCPPEIFKSDYSHYVWYEKIKIIDRHWSEFKVTVIPYSFDHLFHSIKQRIYSNRYVPLNTPKPKWLELGSTLKTRSTFSHNIKSILNEAAYRREHTFLLSFAYYIPDNYNIIMFKAGKLDYYKHTEHPIELWGKPQNIITGIKAHNNEIQKISGSNPQVTFVNMKQIIPEKGLYFNDICHLSPHGCEVFADVLAQKIHSILEGKKTGSK